MSFELERIEALLFDVDGTLSDTDDHMIARLVKFLRPVRWGFKDKDVRPFARWAIMAAETPGNFLYALPDRFGFDIHLARLFNWFAHRRHTRRDPGDLFLLIDGVKEMLYALHLHYPMAIVSARNEPSTLMFLNHFALDHFFQVVITSHTCKHTKPFPDPIWYAAESLGVPVEACLMIGDTSVDVHAALAAGAQSLSVLCGFGTEGELRRAGTHHVLNTTAQVKDLLLSPGI